MNILGLHCGHDGSASVVRDGRLVASVAHERLNRRKKTHGVTPALVDYVCAAAGLTVEDIDAVALSDWNPRFAFSTLEVTWNGDPAPITWNEIFGDYYRTFGVRLRGRSLPGFNIGHHMCHCAAAFYTSPFADAYAFSMDSSGGALRSNSLLAYGDRNKMAHSRYPNLMVGVAYGQFCERLGLGSQQMKAGSMMGLAAYGQVPDRIRDRIPALALEARFEEELGYWAWIDRVWNDWTDNAPSFTRAQSDSRAAMDLAASMQLLFEEAVLAYLRTEVPAGCDRLVLGGGSFLNCNLNSRIKRETRFKDVHLFPACGDDGGSAGAALYVAHHLFDERRPAYLPHEVAFQGAGRPMAERCDLDFVARAIADGKVVGWLHGRGEVGPRALGHASMLADPRSPTMRDHINGKVKMREWFRPFAPSVLAEKAGEWFDFEGPSPYMLFTAKVKQDGVPAVTHVDGTARMQTVDAEGDPLYHELISRFERLSGVPMVLNTSLNGPTTPIIVDPREALDFFRSSPLDLMVIDGKIHTR